MTKGSCEFFNIGTGRGTKTLELYQTIYRAIKASNPELSEALATLEKQQARPGDIRRSCLVVEKAGESLGWIPETDLKEGIKLTLNWRKAEK